MLNAVPIPSLTASGNDNRSRFADPTQYKGDSPGTGLRISHPNSRISWRKSQALNGSGDLKAGSPCGIAPNGRWKGGARPSTVGANDFPVLIWNRHFSP